MMPLPMHWAKAVFPLIKEPGGAAAILPLICSSSPTPVLCQWELGPRSCVESTDPGVSLLCHPWGQEMVHWCLFMKDPEDLCRICPGMTRLWSTPRLFVRATCGRGGGSSHHLPCDFPVTQYGKWDFSAFHLLPQDAHIGAVGTTTSSGLPACCGKTVWAMNFTSSQAASFSQVLCPPLLPEDHPPLRPSVLNCTDFMCSGKNYTCSFSFMSFAGDDISFF